MEGAPNCAERDSVGVADGSALGRCAGPISLLPNLSSQVSAMGSLRSNEGSSGGACLRAQSRRRRECKGSLHRWKLRFCQKRGDKVGKTKRGKGTKIVAVADRHGLPVAS